MSTYRFKVEQPHESNTVVGFVFDEATISVRAVRHWSDDKLHVISGVVPIGSAGQSIIEAEQRRREAWRAPAGAAFWISCAALLVSLAALIVPVARELLGV